MKINALTLALILASTISYGQTNQTPCDGGVLVARNAYAECGQ